MGANASARRPALPKHWPRRVRSAAIHALSLANLVFTVTRSRAENHFSARVRLLAESDRLRSEIALLREELRLKDAQREENQPQTFTYSNLGPKWTFEFLAYIQEWETRRDSLDYEIDGIYFDRWASGYFWPAPSVWRKSCCGSNRTFVL